MSAPVLLPATVVLRLIVVACARARSVAASRLACWTLRSVPLLAAGPTSVRPKGQPSSDAGALAFSSFGLVTNNSRDRAPPPSLPCIVPPPLKTRWPTLRPAALPGSTSAADCRYSAPTPTPFNLLCRLNTTPREEVLLCPRRSCYLPLSS